MRRVPLARRLARRRRLVRALVLGSALAVAGSLARSGVRTVSELEVFRVREIEATGIRYLTSDMAWVAAGLDSATSVWTSTALLEERLELHPLVAGARVERSPPSTLIVAIREEVPVALTASPVVEPVDANGVVLPIDPATPLLDLPLLSVSGEGRADDGARDGDGETGIGVIARDVHHLGEVAPEVLSVVSEVRLAGREATLVLGDEGLRVRYNPPLSERRVREAVIAMNDAHARFPERAAREVDLRFADQVVVRTTPKGPPGDDEACQ